MQNVLFNKLTADIIFTDKKLESTCSQLEVIHNLRKKSQLLELFKIF